jgi:hypothetical protein
MKFVMSYGLFEFVENLDVLQPLMMSADGDVKTFPQNIVTFNTKEECLKYVQNSIETLWSNMERDRELLGYDLYNKSVNFWAKRNELLNTYWNDTNLIERSKWFAKELKKYEFSSIFEVGMYNGRNLKYIHDEFPDVKLGGLDVNEAALDFAKEVLPPNTEFNLTDAINMDTYNKYDIVFTHGVLMHIPPAGISKVIDGCIKKAKKYVIHLERRGNRNYILRGPEGIRPEKICDEFRWEPEISTLYKERGYDPIEYNFQLEDEKKISTLTVIRLR